MKSFSLLQDYTDRVAQIFLSTGAVSFNIDKPFILTSGKRSPVYVDCRHLISFPFERQELMKIAKKILIYKFGVKLNTEVSDLPIKVKFDKIAGGETAGIPYAAWLSDLFHLPMLYVRKKAKGFGRNAQIEGVLEEGDRVLLVEDLATDGGSKKIFVDALRKSGAIVSDIFVLFYYDIFSDSKSKEILSSLGIEMHYLLTWKDVMRVARNWFQDKKQLQDLDMIQTFLDSPNSWFFEHNIEEN